MNEVGECFVGRSSERVELLRLNQCSWEEVQDEVVLEMPVALIYNGYPHVVIMCTPIDIEDFVYGFSLTEGIVRKKDEILSIEIFEKEEGLEVYVEIPEYCVQIMQGRKRQMSARTGCGVCGIDSLSGVVRDQKAIDFDFTVDGDSINLALEDASKQQVITQKTGGAHAAFFVSRAGKILLTREDVGRHVALDKLIGKMMQEKIDASEGFLLTTSRASFEMVQKAVAVQVGLLVTMSAPTTMAIKLAREMNLKLVAFARVGKINLYQ